MFYTYILYSKKRDCYYIGSTSDALEQRIRRHNSNHKGFTGHTGDWQLLYSEEFETKKLALTREKKLKAWKSRKRIEALINSTGLEHSG
jgi:putative endonuclease